MSDGADWRQQEENEQERFETDPAPFTAAWFSRWEELQNELQAIIWSERA